MDAGAFEDATGNAAAGVNGLGSSYDSCVAVSSAPIGRSCLIQFVVPMTLSTTDAFPSEVTGSPVVDLSQATVVTKATNVVLQFPEAVEYTKMIGVASQLTFGISGVDADLDIRTTGEQTCFDSGDLGLRLRIEPVERRGPRLLP
jgi:hypothetical protein